MQRASSSIFCLLSATLMLAGCARSTPDMHEPEPEPTPTTAATTAATGTRSPAPSEAPERPRETDGEPAPTEGDGADSSPVAANDEDATRDSEPTSNEDATGPATIAGTYKLVGGRASLDRAVEGLAKQMGPLKGPIAKKKLLESNDPPSRVEIAIDADDVAVRRPDSRIAGQLDGGYFNTKNSSGDTVRARFSIDDQDRLVEVVAAKDGKRRTVFELREDGDRLILWVTVSSSRLPSALRYRLSYRRT